MASPPKCLKWPLTFAGPGVNSSFLLNSPCMLCLSRWCYQSLQFHKPETWTSFLNLLIPSSSMFKITKFFPVSATISQTQPLFPSRTDAILVRATRVSNLDYSTSLLSYSSSQVSTSSIFWIDSNLIPSHPSKPSDYLWPLPWDNSQPRSHRGVPMNGFWSGDRIWRTLMRSLADSGQNMATGGGQHLKVFQRCEKLKHI